MGWGRWWCSRAGEAAVHGEPGPRRERGLRGQEERGAGHLLGGAEPSERRQGYGAGARRLDTARGHGVDADAAGGEFGGERPYGVGARGREVSTIAPPSSTYGSRGRAVGMASAKRRSARGRAVVAAGAGTGAVPVPVPVRVSESGRVPVRVWVPVRVSVSGRVAAPPARTSATADGATTRAAEPSSVTARARASAVRAASRTLAPPSTRRLAMARPIPPASPTTTALLCAYLVMAAAPSRCHPWDDSAPGRFGEPSENLGAA